MLGFKKIDCKSQLQSWFCSEQKVSFFTAGKVSPCNKYRMLKSSVPTILLITVLLIFISSFFTCFRSGFWIILVGILVYKYQRFEILNIYLLLFYRDNALAFLRVSSLVDGVKLLKNQTVMRISWLIWRKKEHAIDCYLICKFPFEALNISVLSA